MNPLTLSTAGGPLDAVVEVPGSKSIANRALVCAALADGDSDLTGVPLGDDTLAMVGCLTTFGVVVSLTERQALVAGTGGRIVSGPAVVDARLAGTTSRFVTAVAALADGPITIDGRPPLRARPMGPLHDALRSLGATLTSEEEPGRLPVTVSGPVTRGGTVSLRGDVSSQFLTALMLIAPILEEGLRIELTTPLVSAPYVELTAGVMASFGVDTVTVGERVVDVPASRYRGTAYTIEPDASSASYPLAMAAVAGGRVQIAGLTSLSRQGDVAIAELLARMGCVITDDAAGVAVARDRSLALRGIDVDMADVSDLVPTVAVVAATAATASTIKGVGFIRSKESDRLGDLATELTKTGAHVDVEPDGLHIEPAETLHGAVLETHHDHRLAMAYGVLGTVVSGIEVAEPDVVSKSWPEFWQARDAILGRA